MGESEPNRWAVENPHNPQEHISTLLKWVYCFKLHSKPSLFFPYSFYCFVSMFRGFCKSREAPPPLASSVQTRLIFFATTETIYHPSRLSNSVWQTDEASLRRIIINIGTLIGRILNSMWLTHNLFVWTKENGHITGLFLCLCTQTEAARSDGSLYLMNLTVLMLIKNTQI